MLRRIPAWLAVVIACNASDGQGEGADGEGDGDGEAGSGGDDSSATSVTTGGSASGDDADSGESGGDEPIACVVDGLRTAPPDPDHRGTAMGANGTFSDECDAAGNLLEYVCETMAACSDPPNPDCTYPQTGEVVPQMFDCDGRCVDGACNARCAMIGDALVWVEVGPDTAVFDSDADDRQLDCMLLFDAATDTFDCNASPQPGDATSVTSLGLSGSWCTGGAWGNIGIGTPEQCAYTCTYRYE